MALRVDRSFGAGRVEDGGGSEDVCDGRDGRLSVIAEGSNFGRGNSGIDSTRGGLVLVIGACAATSRVKVPDMRRSKGPMSKSPILSMISLVSARHSFAERTQRAAISNQASSCEFRQSAASAAAIMSSEELAMTRVTRPNSSRLDCILCLALDKEEDDLQSRSQTASRTAKRS